MPSNNDTEKRTLKMNTLYFITFLMTALVIYFGMHYYVYIRIASGLGIHDKAALYLKVFFLIAGASFILGEIIKRNFNIQVFLSFGVIWLGIMAMAFSVFLLKDFLGIFLPLRTKPFTITALIMVGLMAGYSLYNVARIPRVKEIKIPMPKLPDRLSGFTIIQLSDLHLESPKSTKWLSAIAAKTNSFNPDLIVITGDLLDENINQINGFCDILKTLKSKNGIIAVTGNHEFYAGIDNFLNAARQLNLTVLRNQAITIADNSIVLVGLDDDQGKGFSDTGADLDSAMKGVDRTKPIILLAHRPNIFNKAAKAGVDLELSGHTHAGQIPPMDLIIQLYYQYPYGLYNKGGSYLYTTSGTGTWGPPMRLFSRSEIVKIVLTKETSP